MSARLVRGLLAIGLSMLAVLWPVDAAGAAPTHGGPGGYDPPASDYRVRVVSTEPATDAMDLRPVDAGGRLELVSRTDRAVTVLGYRDEPYLRIEGGAVFENVRSPAVYLNRGDNSGAPVPDSADPRSPPEWRRLGAGTSVRWHDLRTRGRERGTMPWVVTVLVDGREVVVAGDVTYVPGPNPVPRLAGALLVAALVTLAGRWRSVRWSLVAAGVILALATALDAVGTWHQTAEAGRDKAIGLVLPAICAFVTAATFRRMRRPESLPDGPPAPFTVVALGEATIVGVLKLDWLSRSQLPTDLPSELARLAVVVALGVGAGVLAQAACQIRHLLTRP